MWVSLPLKPVNTYNLRVSTGTKLVKELMVSHGWEPRVPFPVPTTKKLQIPYELELKRKLRVLLRVQKVISTSWEPLLFPL